MPPFLPALWASSSFKSLDSAIFSTLCHYSINFIKAGQYIGNSGLACCSISFSINLSDDLDSRILSKCIDDAIIHLDLRITAADSSYIYDIAFTIESLGNIFRNCCSESIEIKAELICFWMRYDRIECNYLDSLLYRCIDCSIERCR